MTEEKILVVPAAGLWKQMPYTQKGLITESAEELNGVVARSGVFINRSEAENDPAYKQIIPYAVVRHLDAFLLLQRKNTQGERRLHHKMSIGVGGHINPSEGVEAGEFIRDGLERELNEELHITTGYQQRFIGLINDDTTGVGRVHLGVLFEVEAISSAVSVRETHKMHGDWATIDEIAERYDLLETWSQIVYASYLNRSDLEPFDAPHKSGLQPASVD